MNSGTNHRSKVPDMMLALLLTVTVMAAGCGESGAPSGYSAAQMPDKKEADKGSNMSASSSVKYLLTLASDRFTIEESRLLESHNGNQFNNASAVKFTLEPGESFDLQDLQPYGIFALYLTSDGEFTLSNSSGMSFTSKTVLMEKCSFIDLKIENPYQKEILVKGFLAGE